MSYEAGSIFFLAAIAVVVILSIFSASMWGGGKPEVLPDNFDLTITGEMTVGEFIQQNSLEKPFAKKLLGLQSPLMILKRVYPSSVLKNKYWQNTKRISPLSVEHETKNWFKIPLKFALWFAFMIFCFVLLKSGKITSKNRKWLYAAAFALFGIILGADPPSQWGGL